MRGAGPVIKIQEDEKLNSDRPAEIPNSPEQIATPTSLRFHRILPVIKIPLGDLPKELQEKPGPRKILVVQFFQREIYYRERLRAYVCYTGRFFVICASLFFCFLSRRWQF